MSTLLILAGCDDGGGCTFNSECPEGSYCGDLDTCQVDCTVAEPCPGGALCTTFGMCIAVDAGTADPDGGADLDAGVVERDAGPPPRDAGVDAFDPRPACVIAGGLDGDGDGFCRAGSTDLDCDDARPEAHPDAEELCTTQASLHRDRAIDEDCDGAIDEACPWHFGTPHAIEIGAFDMTGFGLESPRLSADGLRLYLPGGAHTPVRPALILTRASVDAPFGAPTPVATVGTDPLSFSSLTVSSDELEAYFQVPNTGAGMDIFRATRASAGAPFSAATAVAGLNDATNDYHPFLRRDGLELLFVSVRSGSEQLLRATRASATGAWTAPVALAIGATPPSGGVNSPSLSEDGLTLFFASAPAGTHQFFFARRASLDTGVFGEPVEATDLNSPGDSSFFTEVSEATAEVFFASNRDGSQPLAWPIAGGGGLWRARICRDGPCVEAPIACPSTVRSEDGQHCYTALAVSDYETGKTACEATGGHLVEIGSQAEQDLVWSTFGVTVNVWIGLEETVTTDVFGWASGAPVVFASWGTNEPNPGAGEANALMQDAWGGRWSDVPGPTWTAVPVCETEVWPTW